MVGENGFEPSTSTTRNVEFKSLKLTLFPTLALAITVMATTLFGDGLRDALDPIINDKN